MKRLAYVVPAGQPCGRCGQARAPGLHNNLWCETCVTHWHAARRRGEVELEAVKW